MLTRFDDAMIELHVPDNAPPMEKLRAVCQWEIGDPQWADNFVSWARQAGFVIEERKSG